MFQVGFWMKCTKDDVFFSIYYRKTMHCIYPVIDILF
jgi:hypothetical protein